MTFTSQLAELDDDLQDAHLPATESERRDGARSGRNKPENMLNWKKKIKERKKEKKQLFTAARATGTENKH